MEHSNISKSFINNLNNVLLIPPQLKKTNTTTNTQLINHPQLLRPVLPKSRKLPQRFKSSKFTNM